MIPIPFPFACGRVALDRRLVKKRDTGDVQEVHGK
jgi:hypothetical protein